MAMNDHAVDTECYVDYWLCKIDQVGEWQMFPGHPLDRDGLLTALSGIRMITFNGINYDLPLIHYALAGADNAALKAASDDIIKNNVMGWQFMRQHNLTALPFHHIDIMQVLPGRNSLKLFGAKIHAPKLQDLPLPPDASIGPVDRWRLREYCQNDLDTTRSLYEQFADRFAIRAQIGQTYGLDVMSKSDPQIAQMVMKCELGFAPTPEYYGGRVFEYVPPAWVDIDIPALEFTVSLAGKVEFAAISPVKLGEMSYRMGIGGLHSSEKSKSWHSNADFEISDHDVASYYPSLILQCGVSPVQLGGLFPMRYREWYERRLHAKRTGDKATSECLKTFLNGTFGKLGDPYSMFYSPPDLIQVTMSGQLALLMLIRNLERVGIRVVSANTDGIVVYCHRGMGWLRDEVIDQWQMQTRLVMETTRYQSLHSRDVNNYIAIKPDGTVKCKGDYAPPIPVATSWPTPTATVCVDAVIASLTTGLDVEQYIRASTDVRGFLFAQKVSGGAVWREVALGRVARWYWSVDGDMIRYQVNGNKVPLSDSSRPMMELTDGIPHDLDRERYIRRALDQLQEIGV